MNQVKKSRVEELTDWSMFVLWPILFVSFLVLAFYSAPLGLALMILLLTAFAIYFAIVTPTNEEAVWE